MGCTHFTFFEGSLSALTVAMIHNIINKKLKNTKIGYWEGEGDLVKKTRYFVKSCLLLHLHKNPQNKYSEYAISLDGGLKRTQ